METCKEIDRPNDTFIWEELLNLDCSLEDYQDLQGRYSALLETYSKEIENSKKVKKNLEKCLKFYSKLCKKYEAQQKIILSLEKSVKEKMNCLEESFKDQEKMKGLINIYKSERSLYTDESNYDLKRDKEILLDICCQLISESVKTNNIRNLTNLLLRKFRKDLSDEKLNLLKGKHVNFKEVFKIDNSEQQNLIDTPRDNIDLSGYNLNTNFKKEEDLPSLNECSQDNIFNKVNELSNEEKMLKSEFKTLPEHFKENSNEIITKTNNDTFDQSKCISEKKNFHISEKECNVIIEREKNGSEILNSADSLFTAEGSVKVFTNFFETDNGNDRITAETLPKNSMNCLEKNFQNQTVISSNNIVQQENNFVIKKKSSDNLNVHNINFSKKDKLVTEKSKTGEQILEKIVNQNTDCFEIIRGTHSLVNEKIVTPFMPAENNRNCSNGFKSVCLSQLKSSEVIKPKINDKNNSTSNSEITIFHSSQSIFDVPMYQHENEINSNLTGTENSEKLEKDKSFSQNNHKLNNSTENCDIVFESSEGKGEDLSNLKINYKNFDNKKLTNSSPNQNSDFKLVSMRNSEDSIIVDVDDCEKDLSTIFIEMKRIRLLSPIKDIEKRKFVSYSNSTSDSLIDKNISDSKLHESKVYFNNLDEFNDPLVKLEKKRHLTGLNLSKNKKVKTNEAVANNCSTKNESGFLDSIICAMSIQNQEFKSNSFKKEQNINSITNNTEQQLLNNAEFECNLPTYDCVSFGQNRKKVKDELEGRLYANSLINMEEKKENDKKTIMEKFLKKKLEVFISSTNSTKEEANKNVNELISVLKNVESDVIEKVIVSLVFENVNEEIEINERPIPPLTKTQHRLIIVLSVLKTQDSRTEQMISALMTKISQKLFLNQYLWPDETVEMASRFYVALCVNRNTAESIQSAWKFCYQAMMEMNQRSCLIFFVALQTWPIMLHKASELGNNILALTIVNIFLHMPKGPHRSNHKKLLPLKHLLMNFYKFSMDDTIENHTIKVMDLFFSSENVIKSIILLAKYRDFVWVKKNIFSKLLSKLKEWTDEATGLKILDLFKILIPVYLNKNDSILDNYGKEMFESMISGISEILASEKCKHQSELKIIEIFLSLKNFPSAQKIVKEWKPKEPISEDLRNQILNVSSENILRELKFNRKKEMMDARYSNGLKKKRKNNKKVKKKRKPLQKKVNKNANICL